MVSKIRNDLETWFATKLLFHVWYDTWCHNLETTTYVSPFRRILIKKVCQHGLVTVESLVLGNDVGWRCWSCCHTAPDSCKVFCQLFKPMTSKFFLSFNKNVRSFFCLNFQQQTATVDYARQYDHVTCESSQQHFPYLCNEISLLITVRPRLQMSMFLVKYTTNMSDPTVDSK